MASTEELAAVTATLFSLLATRRTPQEPDTTHTRAYWRRQPPAPSRPHSWR
ncbi:acyl-CoA carboxylase subunit epsilon [Streptomyces sp. Tu 2975]|uniref:acyl-CoA carboxylase subunit epsilon n=1 Tax=Streptomyces sp. Tu 2975 TaxID=2676871 RepID=UPI00135C9EEB|nr:acyl-CoA carboxylase subunit epsilon [Streptomyces sp. Tu 2975]QIP88255.1 acyl-CoA carboxylase subunit epsilon [Streptomyces sp. Tu 2975]